MPAYLCRAYNKLSFLASGSDALALVDPDLLSLTLVGSGGGNNSVLVEPLQSRVEK